MTSTDIHVVLKLLSIFIAVIAIIGNVLVCHVIVRLKTMKTSINYIILNLAVLDAISGITTTYYVFLSDHQGVLVEPVLQRLSNESSVYGDVLCKVELFYWIPISISPPLLMIMAYERYKAIVDPFSRVDGTVTKTRLKWALPLAWISGLAYIVTDMSLIRYDEQQRQCSYKRGEFSVYVRFWLCTQYIIPSTAIFVFYARVICALRRQDNALGPQAEAERVRRKAKKKVMRIIIAVTMVFYLSCGIPRVAAVVAIEFFRAGVPLSLLLDILLVLSAFNFAFNPCTYFLFMQSFRDGFRRLFMSQDNTAHPVFLAVLCTSHRSVSLRENKNTKLCEPHMNEPQLLSLKVSNDLTP